MDRDKHNVRLTSAELANLWTQYISDTMSICVISYYLKHVQDKSTREILEFAVNIAKSHVKKNKEFLQKENYPVPKGFTKDDVNLDAPPLFSDTFLLVYMHIMTLHGLTGYAGAVGTSIRKDQVNYFIQCNTETMKLYQMTMEVMVQKGIISRPPPFNVPNEVDFVKDQSFLTGWFGNRRPMSAVEVSGASFNLQKNIVKIVLEMGFSQVVESQEIRKYFKRGTKLCDRQFNELAKVLSDSQLPPPQRWDAEVTSSTVPPFSDKLMLFHIITLVSTAAGYYGAAFSISQRRDLSAKYAMLIMDIMRYAEDGVNILIDKGWFEQPPLADDRESLANKK